MESRTMQGRRGGGGGERAVWEGGEILCGRGNKKAQERGRG